MFILGVLFLQFVNVDIINNIIIALDVLTLPIVDVSPVATVVGVSVVDISPFVGGISTYLLVFEDIFHYTLQTLNKILLYGVKSYK